MLIIKMVLRAGALAKGTEKDAVQETGTWLYLPP
jgi:hypothetical protein